MDMRRSMTIWGVVAAVSVLDKRQWTDEVFDLAHCIPGRVCDNIVDDCNTFNAISDKCRQMLAGLLIPTLEIAPSDNIFVDGCVDEKAKKKQQMTEI
jgi:hypothetical protein